MTASRSRTRSSGAGTDGSSRTIGVGIIGLSARGGWAARAHLPALASLPCYEVRAVSASTPESARLAADKYGIPAACRDHEELVSRSDVDLVVVTVKVPSHFELVAAALRAGKAVLCEWPLGTDLDEAQLLAMIAGYRGVPGFVGLQARSAPVIRFVRDLIADGAIGEVLSTTVLGSGDQWGPTVDPRVTYLLDRENGATLLTIPFAHTVDALCHCLGEFTELVATTAVRRAQVLATGIAEPVPMTAEDQVAVTGVLEGGAVAAIHFRGGRSAGTNLLWEINGTEGDIVLRGDTGHLQYARLELLMTERARGALVPQAVPARYHAVSGDLNRHAYNVAQAYALLASGSGELPTFADGVVRHRMIAAIQRSAAGGHKEAY